MPQFIRPPRPGFGAAVLWCLGFFLLTQLLPGLAAGVILVLTSVPRPGTPAVANGQALLRSPDYARAMLVALALSQLLSIGIAWLVLRLTAGKEWPRLIALRRPSGTHLLLALMGLPGLVLVCAGLDGLARHSFPSLFSLDAMVSLFGKWPWPVGVLVIGLGPGIGEELWFRGFLGRGLVGRYGVALGVGLTSLLFGVAHLEPRQAFMATVIGVFLHLSYLASRSLLVPMLLHAANNTLGVLAFHWPLLRSLDAPDRIPGYVYGAAVLLVAAVGLAFYKSRAVLVNSAGSPWQPAFPGAECPPTEGPTRVRQEAPGTVGWGLAVASLLLFLGAALPEVREVGERGEPERRSPPTVPSEEEVIRLLRQEPISATTWPAWSERLRGWLGDTSTNTEPAFAAARAFLQQSYGREGFDPPMRDDAMAWYVYGRAQVFHMTDPNQAKHRARTAEMLLRRSIELEPDLGRAHYGLAVALFVQVDPLAADDRRLAEARAEATEAERLDPTVSAASAEAWAAMLQNRFDDAEQLYRRALKERPDEAGRARSVATAVINNLNRPGSYGDAVAPLVQRFPGEGHLRCLYALALYRDGRFQTAARELSQARGLGVDPVKSLGADDVTAIEANRNRPDTPRRPD